MNVFTDMKASPAHKICIYRDVISPISPSITNTPRERSTLAALLLTQLLQTSHKSQTTKKFIYVGWAQQLRCEIPNNLDYKILQQGAHLPSEI